MVIMNKLEYDKFVKQLMPVAFVTSRVKYRKVQPDVQKNLYSFKIYILISHDLNYFKKATKIV